MKTVATGPHLATITMVAAAAALAARLYYTHIIIITTLPITYILAITKSCAERGRLFLEINDWHFFKDFFTISVMHKQTTSSQTEVSLRITQASSSSRHIQPALKY